MGIIQLLLSAVPKGGGILADFLVVGGRRIKTGAVGIHGQLEGVSGAGSEVVRPDV